jgi:hypothetical protein
MNGSRHLFHITTPGREELKKMKIPDAYISIEIKTETIERFRSGLKGALRAGGLECEDSSPSLHVSLAYVEGDADLDDVTRLAEKVAALGFEAKAVGFEILEGQATPYDYLALQLDSKAEFDHARAMIEGEVATRRFKGGFKSHISLLKFAKGSLSAAMARELVRELNASHGAALALGCETCLEGECVCVFDTNRERRLSVPCAA